MPQEYTRFNLIFSKLLIIMAPGTDPARLIEIYCKTVNSEIP